MNNMSKTNKLLIIIGLLIVTVIVFFYVEKNTKNVPVAQIPTPELTNTVTYYCQEGILKVSYGSEKATVNFPDGRTLAFSQSISADGGRYESGTTVFWSKGDNAFVSENDKQTFTNCVTGNQTTDQEVSTFTDVGKTFSFSYPNQFKLSGGEMGYSQNWKSNANSLGLLLTVVQIPKSFLPNTNFSEAKFTVGTSADPVAIKNCLKTENGEVVKTEKVEINGTSFTEITINDAGAGNFYETTSYRALQNDQCYGVEYTIHSTNIGNYSADQEIKEFDKTKITSILEGIVQSFKFL